MPPLSLNLLITARIPLVTMPPPSTKEAVRLHRYNVKKYSPHH